MSCTYSLVCHETKRKIWIGQGNDGMTVLYSGEKGTMERLKRFLNEHQGYRLEFLCNDWNDDITDYKEQP